MVSGATRGTWPDMFDKRKWKSMRDLIRTVLFPGGKVGRWGQGNTMDKTEKR